jgi:protoporphyrinogen/coproporphyrinogen III oxidase
MSDARPARPRRVAVIGGGIAGLAAAHRLVTLEPSTEVALFEAAGRVGGVLQTDRIEGYLVERSADSFVTNVPGAVTLCRELGLENELIETEASRRKAWVVRGGRLYPVPDGFQLMTPSQIWPLATSRLLSVRGKLRMLREYFIKPRTDTSDESLESFVVRRLGREAFDRLVQPLVAGIFTADPAKLSMRAALPKFCELEAKHGGLIRAARRAGAGEKAEQRASSGARYGLFVAPRGGIGQLVDAVAAALPPGCIRLNAPVKSLAKTTAGWSVTGAGGAPESFDAVVVALPAPHAARLLADVDASLTAELSAVPYAGASIVISGYELKQIEKPLDAFGFVVPEIERRDILAASFSSRKFPGRAPEGCVLIRTFIGGATRPELIGKGDDELRTIVARELGDLIGAHGAPNLSLVQRWYGAMPQYHVGHLDRVRRIDERLAGLSGLALAGNAYRGVGIPQCITSGRAAAERLV